MGASNVGLFDDDTTCDVRDDYVANLKQGLSDSEASQSILDRFGDLLANRQIECLVYFALADTQWRYGRLLPRIKKHALELIASGGDVSIWEADSPSDAPARQAVLFKLKKRLLSEAKPRRHVAVRPKIERWYEEHGAVYAVQLPNGSLSSIVLAGSLSTNPLFYVLNWSGKDLPTRSQIEAMLSTPVEFKTALGRSRQLALVNQKRKPPAQLIPTKTLLANPPKRNHETDGEPCFVEPDELGRVIQAGLTSGP